MEVQRGLNSLCASVFARMGDNREFAVKGGVIRCCPPAEACGMSAAARTAQPVPKPPLCPLIKLRNWIPGVAALNSFTVQPETTWAHRAETYQKDHFTCKLVAHDRAVIVQCLLTGKPFRLNAICSSEITQVFLMSKTPESALLKTASFDIEVGTFLTLCGTAELSKYCEEGKESQVAPQWMKDYLHKRFPALVNHVKQSTTNRLNIVAACICLPFVYSSTTKYILISF